MGTILETARPKSVTPFHLRHLIAEPELFRIGRDEACSNLVSGSAGQL